LTNKEMLDLAEGLGIGVKSHSSSIEEAQADRARRKAEREGLIRDVSPEEPAPVKKAAKKATKATARDDEAAAPAADGDGAARPAATTDDGPSVGAGREGAGAPDGPSGPG